jgi:hypothetical protein
MAKKPTQIDKAIQGLDNEIASLQAARLRLVAVLERQKQAKAKRRERLNVTS